MRAHYVIFPALFVVYAAFAALCGWGFRHIRNVDLPSFYTASVAVFKNGLSPYDLGNLYEVLPSRDQFVFPYLYPPPSLFFFFPLSQMSYPAASVAVLLLNHALILALLWLIPCGVVRLRPKRSTIAFALGFVYMIASYPLILTLEHGQVNIVCLTFIVLFWLHARRNHDVAAAFFLGLAILLKTYPLALIPMLALIGRWRLGAYALAWLAVPTLASFLFLPHGLWHDWLANVAPTGSYMRTPAGMYSPAEISNQNFNGFFARLLTENRWSPPLLLAPELARLLTYGAAGLVVAISGWAIWRRRSASDPLDRAMLVAPPLIYLISPFSWEHHLVFLLPTIFMLLNSRCAFDHAPRMLFYAAGAGAATVIALPGLLALKFYAVVLLWATSLCAVISPRAHLPPASLDADEGRHAGTAAS